MNAMTAVALPAGAEIRPRQAPRPHCAPSPGRAPGPRPAPGPGRAPGAPLRLTRRGRVVAALLVTVLSLLAAGAAQAMNHSVSPRAARQNLVQVLVGPGQSLWSVAESADSDEDTRAVIQQIVDLNALSGTAVFAGQQLWVPRD